MAWNIDASHSQIQFAVRHMMISNARGRFEEFTGTVDFDENDLSTLSVDVSIDTASINTRDEKRDEHLRSADFFNTAEFPKMTFRSTGVEKVDNNNLKLHGELTIRDITKPVTLDVEYAGTVVSPWGTTSAGFSASTKINRKEWGLTWNATLEAGGVLVGEDIRIELELELIKEQVAVEAVA
jgi:polyisoprenoid-binding protein YceI